MKIVHNQYLKVTNTNYQGASLIYSKSKIQDHSDFLDDSSLKFLIQLCQPIYSEASLIQIIHLSGHMIRNQLG